MNSQTKMISTKIRKTLGYMDLEGLDEYINEKYEKLLKVYSKGKTETQIGFIIDSITDDEIVFLSSVSESDLPSMLVPDKDLNALIELSAEIFDEARNCLKSGKTIDNKKQYEKKVFALSNYMQDVKPYNYYIARSYYSKAILDLNYMHGKSSSMSLRLASAD